MNFKDFKNFKSNIRHTTTMDITFVQSYNGTRILLNCYFSCNLRNIFRSGFSASTAYPESDWA